MKKYVYVYKRKVLAECEAYDWHDAVAKFMRMGYSLYKGDVVLKG